MKTIVKTVQAELKGITNVAANAQSISSELDLSGQQKKVIIYIDHGRTAATAFVGAGTEYRIEVSQKRSGDDTWVPIASVVAEIDAATAIVMDGSEAAGSTVIECGAGLPAVGDYVYFKNGTIANSEWAKVVAIVSTGGSESFTIQNGLTNTQAAITLYNKARRFAIQLDVEPFVRLRVVCNNNNGSTNQAIDWRCAATTQE